jgi:hypothetical protein
MIGADRDPGGSPDLRFAGFPRRPAGVLLWLLLASPAAGDQVWTATDGVVTLAVDDRLLEGLGLRIVAVRSTAVAPAPRDIGLEPPLHAFAFDAGRMVRFRTRGGRLLGFEAGSSAVTVQGGLAFAAKDPATGEALAPLLLFDFAVDIAPEETRFARLLTADPALPAPLEVHGTSARFDAGARQLVATAGDLRMSQAWAARLGRPELAGLWIGGVDLRLTVSTPDRTEKPAPEPYVPVDTGIDLLLSELYGVASLGHIGFYPNGRSGFSVATSVCNDGGAPIPWNAPMVETHPMIGMAMYRLDAAGRLEMIGTSWMKHGFNALSQDLCSFGCNSSRHDTLDVACSDTYSVINNGTRLYLGPREEVDPYTGSWEACGSWFDDTPVDCQRDYYGDAADLVEHRLEVEDSDLAVAGASFYCEAAYIVAGDRNLGNHIGWRQILPTWVGSAWLTPTVGSGNAPNYGPRVSTWGDLRYTTRVAQDDGEVLLAVRVTDLGGGTWHYEYALFNWRSGRGVRSFDVPVGPANVTNIGFHDVDKDPANDWTVSQAGGRIEWSTTPWASDPSANALRHHTMYNFRFDADRPPVDALALCDIFAPGIAASFSVETRAPAAAVPATARAEANGSPSLSLAGPTSAVLVLDRPAAARLSVIDVTGRTVRVLLDGAAPGGRSEHSWDRRDSRGAAVASGVYFFRLEAEGRASTARTVVVR